MLAPGIYSNWSEWQLFEIYDTYGLVTEHSFHRSCHITWSLIVSTEYDSYYSEEDTSSSTDGSDTASAGTMTPRSPVKSIHLSPVKAQTMPRALSRSSESLFPRSRSPSDCYPTDASLVIPSLHIPQRKRSSESFRMEDLGQLRPELYQTDEKCAHERTKPGKKIEEVVEEFYGNTWFAVRFDRKESRSVTQQLLY